MNDKIKFKRVIEYKYGDVDRLYLLKTGYFELFEYDLDGKTMMQTSGYFGKSIDFLLRNKYDDKNNLISTKKITDLNCEDNQIKIDEIDLNNIDQLLELLEIYEEYYDEDKQKYIQKLYYNYNFMNKLEEINEYWGDYLHQKQIFIYDEKGNLLDGCYYISNGLIDDNYYTPNYSDEEIKLEYEFGFLDKNKYINNESNIFRKYDDNGNLIYKDEIINRNRCEIFYNYDEENYLIEEKVVINNDIITSKVKKYEYFLF